MRLRHVVLSLALCVAVSATGAAQSAPFREVLLAVGSRSQAQLVLLDPRVFPGTPAALSAAVLHPDSILQSLRGDTAISVLSPELAEECSGTRRSGCHREGRMTLVHLSAPSIRGDTATITAFVRSHHIPSANDSTRVRSALTGRDSALVRTALNRLNMGSATRANITVVRTDNRWRVRSYVIVGQS